MANDSIPVAAPVTTDTAGNNSDTALQAVMQIACPTTGSAGTGFLHPSGWVITAEHVVRDAAVNTVRLRTASGYSDVSEIKVDRALDLAILKPTAALRFRPLTLCPRNSGFAVGTQISTWGFPGGYSGVAPMLTVGYLSGVEPINGIARWVVNAAFNSGNSGGPVLRLEDGAVMGVVASKLAPLPQHIESILNALAQQQSGFMYEYNMPDGSKKSFSEGQLVGEVLKFLRSQTQLVVGHAVILENVYKFLSDQGVNA